MFYILPFNESTNMEDVDLNDYMDILLFNNDSKLRVIDSNDMVEEVTTVSTIKDLMRKHLAKFPQLWYKREELYMLDSYLDITDKGVAKFRDSKNGQRIKVTKSRKSFKRYNSVFNDYIEAMNVEFEDDYNCVEYTANTIVVTGSNTRLSAKITVQGIMDDYDNPISVALFVNEKFICYLDPEICFDADSVDLVVPQFCKVGKYYELTILSPTTSRFFIIKLSSMLQVKDICRLDTMKDKEYYNR